MTWSHYFPLFLLLLSIGACQNADKLAFPEEKMVEVVADMQMAEASMQRLTKKVKDTLSLRYYDEIYEIHGIDEEAFLHNIEIMERNPELAKRIYDAVMEKISREENE